MKTISIRVITALLLLAACAFAQTAATPTTPATALPGSFLIGIGGGYNSSGYNGAGSQKAAALVEFGYQPGTTSPTGSNLWITTTFITQPGKASGINTLRAGIGYSIKKSGNWNLILTADGGGTSTVSSVLGTVGGGIKLRYDLGGLNKSLAGIGIAPTFRVAAISGTSVQPEYTLTLSKRF